MKNLLCYEEQETLISIHAKELNYTKGYTVKFNDLGKIKSLKAK